MILILLLFEMNTAKRILLSTTVKNTIWPVCVLCVYNNAHCRVHDFDSLCFKLVSIIYGFGWKTIYCTNWTKGNDSLIESNSLSKKEKSYKIVYFNQINSKTVNNTNEIFHRSSAIFTGFEALAMLIITDSIFQMNFFQSTFLGY